MSSSWGGYGWDGEGKRPESDLRRSTLAATKRHRRAVEFARRAAARRRRERGSRLSDAMASLSVDGRKTKPPSRLKQNADAMSAFLYDEAVRQAEIDDALFHFGRSIEMDRRAARTAARAKSARERSNRIRSGPRRRVSDRDRTRSRSSAGSMSSRRSSRRSTYGRRKRRRTASVYRGKGFYKGFLRDAGGLAGGLVGRAIGAPGLGKVGSVLGSGLSKVFGWGDYKVNHNSLLQPINARIRNDPILKDATHIRHREYIGDIKSSVGFSTQYSLPINPGMAATFPWASSTASNFQQYALNGLMFEYVPSSGDAVSSTNNALGQVMFAVQYDTLDSAFSNKQQLLNESWSQAVVPSQPVLVPVECAPDRTTLTKLYTRFGEVPAGGDRRMFDLGNLTVATQGQQAADITLGSLYVTYDIMLLKPTLVGAMALNQRITHYRPSVGTVTNALPLGTAQTEAFDSLGCTVSGQNITIQANNPGQYSLTCCWIGASTALLVAPVVTYTNATGTFRWANNSAHTLTTVGTSTNLFLTATFEVDDPTKEVVLAFGAAGTLPTSISSVDIQISQINADYA